MRKITILFVTAVSMLLASCGLGTMGTTGSTTNTTTSTTNTGANTGSVVGSVLSGVLSSVTNGQTIGNVLQSVLGLDKLTQQNLIGTWTYSQPGCAFTSEKLLAQAGGEAVATSIKDKLLPYYQKVGINSSNTRITFNQNGTFSATIAGKSFSGQYTFDEANYKITLQGMLLSFNCYAKKNSNGIALLFEASKLLTVLQTLTALSGNSTIQGIGDLSKNFDGLRIGFDFTH